MGYPYSCYRFSYFNGNGIHVMAASFEQLINNQLELSFTPPHSFFMVIEKLPATVFTLQRVQIPVINGEELTMPSGMNPNKTMIPGSGLDYSVLSCDFIIDKHFKAYREVLNWFKGIGAPEDKALQAVPFKDTMSNINIIGTDAANTPLVLWNFVDAFPISVDGPMFDATMPDIEYLTSNVTFRHKYFTFTTYTNGASDNNTI